MSLSPLRIYLHSEALTWEGIRSYINTKPQQSLTLSELQQLISESQESTTAESALDQLKETILVALLHIEDVARQRTGQDGCLDCFQVLEVAAVFNASLHPFILQVRPYAHTGKMASLNDYFVRQRILEEMAVMLVAKDSVVMDVARALVELGLTNEVDDGLCNSEQSFCLSEEDLQYSLCSRRENLHKGTFIKIYPSTSAVKYTQILQRYNSRRQDWRNQPSSTSQLHSYLLGLESYFQHMEEDNSEIYDDVNVPIDYEGKRNTKKQTGNSTGLQSKLECNNDPASMPYLMHVLIKPEIDLLPEFSPFTTEYHALVSYETLMITVLAAAKSCSSQARLEDKHGSNREGNFTLGQGENRVTIFVVDISHADAWVLNTYTILIQRQGPDYHLTAFVPGMPHQVCSLLQDCSLRFMKASPCGLHPVHTERNWTNFVQRKLSQTSCTSGDIEGQWYVPCTDCNVSASCYWRRALWQPHSCSYKWMPRWKVQQCFAKKKVLFIGDSTNRGIMNYITEQVNGTLQEWDKTHHLKIYTNLNHHNTTFSFAYYPQFWLPSDHRPVLDKALYQLIKQNMPLANNSQTVLVIGGVQWLAKHHIDVVLKALTREGLTGIQLVAKGLGAGFHQPVSGVHCLNIKDHQRLLYHNQATLSYAKRNGFHVVDTYNLTMSRFKDFLQGKCACHFHRVVMTKTKKSGSLSNPRTSTSGSPITVYHVEGEINAVYSEMMINQICGYS